MNFSIDAYKTAAGTALILLLLSVWASASSVCPSGCNHKTIDEALNASTPGEIISIQSGTYHESPNITRSVTLMGRGMPVVDAEGRSFAIALHADGVKLEGLAAANSSGTGIEVISSDNAILACDVRQNPAGIDLQGSMNILYGNSISQNDEGIILNGSDNNSIAYNNISSNSKLGLVLVAASNNTIRGNSISDNGLGISLNGSTGNLLYQNSLANADDAYDDGQNRWDNGTTGNHYSNLSSPGPVHKIPGGRSRDDHSQSSAAEASGFQLSPQDAYNLTREDLSLVIIDVRTPEEYEGGHIHGASNIDYYSPDFNDRLRSLEKNKRYLIYCRAGNRGRVALEIMRALGFDDAYNVSGGILQWEADGYPVEKGA
jgi:parallel beta-helix repeat protein